MKTMSLVSNTTRSNSQQGDGDRGKYDDFLPAVVILPLIIAIWLRLKCKTEIPHCFAIFISIFAPLIVILLMLESDAPLKEVGAIVIAIPLGWWIKEILKGLIFG